MRKPFSYDRVAGRALSAALEVEYRRQNKEYQPAEIAQLIEALEEATDMESIFFWRVFKRLGHSDVRMLPEVQALLRAAGENLRTIEVYGVGDLAAAKAFCLVLNEEALVQWQKEWRDARCRMTA